MSFAGKSDAASEKVNLLDIGYSRNETEAESKRPNTVEPILPFLIVCPLALVAGFVDAIAGGGGLISLPAFFMAGVPAHVAVATNKMTACMGTALATGRFIKQGFVDWKSALPCAGVAIVGSAAGANLTLAFSDEVLRWIMLVIVPLTAAYIMRPKSMEPPDEPLSPRRMMALSLAVALAIGVYDGFYGPGTGTFLMLAFTSIAGMALNQAAGATKVVNLSTNISALVVFLMNGQVWLLLGIVAGLFNMLGAWMGVSLFNGKGAGAVKPIMLLVLALFFVKMLGELVM